MSVGKPFGAPAVTTKEHDVLTKPTTTGVASRRLTAQQMAAQAVLYARQRDLSANNGDVEFAERWADLAARAANVRDLLHRREEADVNSARRRFLGVTA